MNLVLPPRLSRFTIKTSPAGLTRAASTPSCHSTVSYKTSQSKMSSSALTLQSRLKLNSGYEIPQLGFGVYQILAEECESCVLTALDLGYRHIDSAVAYKNQPPCGSAILKFCSPSSSSDKNPTISRSQIFYTSKVRPKSMSYASAREQVDQTLSETGLGYIDLMLLHSPYGGPENRKGAWKALVECVDEGKIRSIGVSNYGMDHLLELEEYIEELSRERGGKGKEKGGILSVGQWEVHPWLPRRDIVGWCRERGVVVEAYCPIVRGGKDGDELLEGIRGKNKNKSTAQVLIRWSLQKGYVPMPKSRDFGRIRENSDVFDFEIDEEDMKRLELDSYEPCAWDPTTSGLEA